MKAAIEINELKRKQANYELIQRMRAGSPLQRFSAQQSWFPPRPIIKKDRRAVARLYASATPISAGCTSNSRDKR